MVLFIRVKSMQSNSCLSNNNLSNNISMPEGLAGHQAPITGLSMISHNNEISPDVKTQKSSYLL
jgi:hypothetical protein